VRERGGIDRYKARIGDQTGEFLLPTKEQ